jgi:hypothetical protein
MNKQYKLLKTYEHPCGKTHAGVIETEEEWMRKFQGLQKGDCDIKTDWFQLIEQREWEIVELINKFREKTKDVLCIYNWLNKDKRYEDWSIHSVKRLSDGEVFTVGDEVGYDNGNIRTKQDWKIDHFYIRESDGVLLARSKDCANVELVDKWLYKSTPSKQKEPLFTQQQMDKAIEDAFYAARECKAISVYESQLLAANVIYSTLQDYLKSKNNKH